MSDRRAECHQLLDQVLDAMEAAKTAEPESEDQIKFAERAYFDGIDLLNVVAGSAVTWILKRAGRGIAPRNPNVPEAATENPSLGLTELSCGEVNAPQATTVALARLIYDLRDVVGDAMPSKEFARDLYQAATAGASPQALWTAAIPRGGRDNRDLKAAARRRLVLAVYYDCGRTGKDNETCATKDWGISEGSWRKLRKETPKDERDRYLAAGKAGEPCGTAISDLEPDNFRKIRQMAEMK